MDAAGASSTGESARRTQDGVVTTRDSRSLREPDAPVMQDASAHRANPAEVRDG